MPQLKNSYPLYVGGKAEEPNLDLEVIDKYTGELAFRVPKADPKMIDRAIGMAEAAAPAMAKLASHQRQAILSHCVSRFRERYDELAYALCVEAGKPIGDAEGEVDRLIDTFEIAAEEAVRFGGEVVPLDISPRAAGYRSMYKRVPLGPLSFISPFNFPLNLAAHKIAPAIAAGCPFILKPASATPLGALIIGEVLAETDIPAGAFSILPCDRDGADLFTTDERLKLLSFTGSDAVGWKLKSKAGKKKVVLELGGNAATVVDRDADLDRAIDRLIKGAFYQSGQSCIGVQRILIHSDIYETVRERFVAETKKLKMGDPKKRETFIGPMISGDEAKRLKGWIDEAIEAGATKLCGGGRDGAMLEATVLENVPKDAKVNVEEAFGPVANLSRFDDFEEALEEVNASRYGLQAGVFTNNLTHAMLAWDRLEVGGVIVNDNSSFRVDHMPYGGVKDSGLGREGIRYAMEDMSEIRNLVIYHKADD